MSALPAPPLRRILLATVATVSGGLLLLSLKPHSTGGAADVAARSTSPAAAPSASAAPSAPASPQPSASGGKSSSGSSGSSKAPSTSSAPVTRTVDGDTVQTRYGPVQLRVTLTGGKITAVTTLQLPQDNPRDQEISGFAVPQLTQEALAAQSARIDSVSGASYTSDGYIQSLQSALDKAGA
ncbi:FMN-binding protein [Streptomyces sp. NPDC051976]|uniref:FMN-binding protein n=1 Tax=Streptomyces sp. NPDC051976 TaxID=3154947 RepID=UPI003447F661